MTHFVDILGTGQLEDRNQISFLERTDEKLASEETRREMGQMSEGSLPPKLFLI